MLDAAQLEQRQRTIGASEVSAIVGVNPWQDASDIWCRKARGPDGELPQLVTDEPDAPGIIGPRTVGNEVEESTARLYGLLHPELRLERSGTLVHRDYPWASATPDRLAYPLDISSPSHGLEAKAVGWRIAHHWEEGLPDYVLCQCMWSMHVSGFDRWDAAALLGTEFRGPFVVLRDDELIGQLHEAAERFWRDHVLANVPPEPRTADAAKRLVGARYRIARGEVIDCSGDLGVANLVEDYAAASAAVKDAEERKGILAAQLCTRVGDAGAIKGPWGKFAWPEIAGAISWKSVAEELAGERNIAAIVESHRGKPYRKPGFFPARTKKGK